MERKIYLRRYRVRLDQVGIPVVIRRSAREATFEADDLESGEQVAVQVVPATTWYTSDRKQLEDEGAAAEQINHANIPAVRAFGFDDDQLIYVMEHFEGTTAKDWVKEKGPMPVSVVLRIAAQVVSALGAATFHGVNHPAINPANIMLVPGQTAEGEWPLIKVMNFFGVAPALSASSLNRPAAIKPADFASPEQLRGEEVDFRSQIYSLGCTLWFLLRGTPPSAGESAKAGAGRLPGPVKRLLLSMMAENPDDRPLDPLALREEIQNCLAQVERRGGGASKFALPGAATEIAPALTEGIEAHGRSAWKPIAFAAVLLALAAMTAAVISYRWHPRQAIGVPVGVPEQTASPEIAPAEPASQPDASPPVNAATESLPAQPNATEPAVLTSTAVAASEETPSSSENATPAEVASGPSAAAIEDRRAPTPDVMVAETAPIPEPSTAPRNSPPSSLEDTTARAEEPARASEEPTASRIVTEVTPRPTASPAGTVLQKVPITSAGEATAKSTPEIRVAQPVPRKPRPTPRPQMPVGTTVVPPNEPVYAAPAVPVRREEQRRRQRAPKRDPLLDLPVLPALPPDE